MTTTREGQLSSNERHQRGILVNGWKDGLLGRPEEINSVCECKGEVELVCRELTQHRIDRGLLD